MRRLYLSIFTISILAIGIEASGLDYINELRAKAGLVNFSENSQLTTAARNHSQYLYKNGLTGHYEQEGDVGFTGVRPADRAVYAGYPARQVSENVSSGKMDIRGSIDGLFGAIYHRFGFLDIASDEIGIGVSDDTQRFTYDMGNSAIRELCLNDYPITSNSYYRDVCANRDKKIDAKLYEDALNNHKDEAPAVVIWPPEDSDSIPPVFYEESPDPLPNSSVSGYPISIQFNDAKFKSRVEVTEFSIKDESGKELELVAELDKNSDPNGEFKENEFAIFPKQRLDWGSNYYVKLNYLYDGAEHKKEWCFSTKSLEGVAERVYKIVDKSLSLNVVSGIKYALYFPPKDGNDRLGAYSISYTQSTEIDSSYLDQNTILITLKGGESNWAKISFDNGNSVELRITDSDSASVPKSSSCNSSKEDDTNTPETTVVDDETATDTDDDKTTTSETTSDGKEDDSNTPEETTSDDGVTTTPETTVVDDETATDTDDDKTTTPETTSDGKDEGYTPGTTADKDDKTTTPEGSKSKNREENRDSKTKQTKKPTVEDSSDDLVILGDDKDSKNQDKPKADDSNSNSTSEDDITLNLDNNRVIDVKKSPDGKGITFQLTDSGFSSKQSIVDVDLEETFIDIDDSYNTLIRPDFGDYGFDLLISIDKNGVISLNSDSILEPKNPLPFGTKIEVDESMVIATIPLDDELRF